MLKGNILIHSCSCMFSLLLVAWQIPLLALKERQYYHFSEEATGAKRGDKTCWSHTILNHFRISALILLLTPRVCLSLHVSPAIWTVCLDSRISQKTLLY